VGRLQDLASARQDPHPPGAIIGPDISRAPPPAAVIDIKPVKASTDQPAKPKITEPLDPRKYALTG
jgi:hypothetical protein